MQKKSKLLVFLPLILMLAIFVSTTSSVAFATGTENLDLEYSVLFPSEDSYVELNNPTNIAVNDKIAIFDTDKIYTNKTNRFVPFAIADKNITNLQISNDLVCYMVGKKIKIYNNGIDITEKLDSILANNELENNYIFNMLLVNNDLLFVTSPDKLIKVSFNPSTNNFENYEQKLKHEGLFESKNIFVYNNDLYFTTTDNKINKININNELTTLYTYNKDKSITYNNSYVVEYDKNNISINTFAKNIKNYTTAELNIGSINNCVVYNDRLYISTGNNVIEYLIGDAGIIEIKNYGKTGDYKDKLASPISTAFADNKIYVLDSKNNKIKEFSAYLDSKNASDVNEFIIPTNVENFAINKNTNTKFYSTDSKLYITSKNNQTISINSTGIKQIKPFMDTILVLKDNILQIFDNTTNELKTILSTNILNFASNENSDFIYIYDGINIDKYLAKNNNLIKEFTVSMSANNIGDIKDFEIDNNGNIFALFNNKIATIINGGLTYNNATIKTLSNKTYPIKNITDIALKNDGFLLTDNTANLVYFAKCNDIISTPKQDILLNQKPLEKEMDVIKTTEDTLIYSAKDTLESAFIVPQGEMVFVFNDDNLSTSEKKLIYFFDTAEETGKLGYMFSKNYSTVTKTTLNYNAITASSTTLYMYPYANDIAKAQVLPLEKNTKVKILSTVEGYSNGNNNGKGIEWYEIEYDNNRYFVIKNDLTEDNTTNETTGKIATMITKSSRPGEKVNMYAFNDLESKVLDSIIDGEVVEVIEKFDGFYKVKYNDKIGYIEEANLIESGLTNNQLIAIIVSVVTIVVAIIIFACTMVIKNKKK